MNKNNKRISLLSGAIILGSYENSMSSETNDLNVYFEDQIDIIRPLNVGLVTGAVVSCLFSLLTNNFSACVNLVGLYIFLVAMLFSGYIYYI